MNNNILIPTGVWIEIEDHGNGVMSIDMSQFSQEILENKEIWTTFKPS